MNRAAWILMALIGALLFTLWAVLNRPDQAPVWPESIQGTSFSPFRPGQSPQSNIYPTADQILADLRVLRGKVKTVRTYSVADILGRVPHLAAQLNMDVHVGIWLSGDTALDRAEIDRFRELYPTYGNNVTGIVVGNETLLRGDLTVGQLSAYLDEIHQFVDGQVPITTAETWDNWLRSPLLVEHVDYISTHVLPYWEGVPAAVAPQYVFQRLNEVSDQYPFTPVMLGEVGWPSEGRQRGGAVPTLQNQAKFLREFLYLAEKRNVRYFIIEAFDQVWKTDEGAVGRYWGIFDAERKPKFAFNAPIPRLPDWPAIAAFSLAFTILIAALLLRDSQGLVHRGRGFLVMVSYLISFVVVYLVYDYSSKYLTWEQVVVGIGLMLAMFTICIVLLAEAHEWAEAIWGRRLDTQPVRNLAYRHHWPKVSLHVPTYNEPPDMVLRTLRALARLDYPALEVIVVDNNTNDPEIWQPVQQWCARHPGRFQFHHVNPLKGFKAGALNYALEHTATDAEIVAVIDSDYEVAANWLVECVPLFDAEDVAIVQAPQDYRDSRENAFKNMLYDEYAGFFGIGMLTRNARNAIIQHGTMTLVRRSTLESVGRWSEWCITEDAELGLRVLAAGHRAIYVPRSYGRGLTPDNFLDYKKQRFRWAYGSALILRHHLRYFLNMSRSHLTWGQRYHFLAGWMPWMADGLSLGFNCVALFYAVLMVLMPYTYMPPEVALSLLPIIFFGFKLTKMLILYRRRMRASWRQALAACLAGLSLSHTIARAMLASMHTRHIGFYRTPKLADGHKLLQALADVREELLFGIALVLAAGAIALRYDAYLLDTQLWVALLLIQSLPYWSAVTMSIISTRKDLPAALIEGPRQKTLLEHLPETLDWGNSIRQTHFDTDVPLAYSTTDDAASVVKPFPIASDKMLVSSEQLPLSARRRQPANDLVS